jgi:predicted nucleic acid-binding protein
VTRHLLDVNVVIAIIDPLHIHHGRAHRWFAARGTDSWHTSPTVQNGVVRAVSHPKYPNSQPTPVVVNSLTVTSYPRTPAGDAVFVHNSGWMTKSRPGARYFDTWPELRTRRAGPLLSKS